MSDALERAERAERQIVAVLRRCAEWDGYSGDVVALANQIRLDLRGNMKLSDIIGEDELALIGDRQCEFDDCACRGTVHDAREES